MSGSTFFAERDEELECDKAVMRWSGSVAKFSQRRASDQTPGISDRRYYVFRLAFWWEVKTSQGKLRQEQYEFLQREANHDALAACGTAAELTKVLEAVAAHAPANRRAAAEELARNLRETWRAKGFRTS